MADKTIRQRIDAQWREQASVWGQENHVRKRTMIYDYIEQDEDIRGLVGCTWGPESAFRSDAGFLLRMERLKGVAVATNRSVHLLARRGLNKLVTEIPLPDITSVEHANGIVTIDGDRIHNWAGMAQDDPFRIERVQGNQGARFADLVQRLQTAPHSAVAPPSASQYWGMSKSERIDAQWQERSLSGDNGKKYDSERKKLHEILDEDENLELWLGGRWGLPDDFESPLLGGPGSNRSGHKGIAVATDRRVLLLQSGLLGSREVELPYDRIDDVGYNDGMISSGVEFRSSAIESYSFYFDHNNKAGVKGAARRLVDCVRQHLAAPPTSD